MIFTNIFPFFSTQNRPLDPDPSPVHMEGAPLEAIASKGRTALACAAAPRSVGWDRGRVQKNIPIFSNFHHVYIKITVS